MFIGICGGSGAGKTAFINAVRKHFNENQLGLISEDNYYHPVNLQKPDHNGVINFDIPESIDHDAFIADLNALKLGKKVERKEYTFNNDLQTAKMICINPAPVYLVEGLFISHHSDTRNIMDLLLLIHATEKLKIERRITRDREERNYSIEDVLYRYEHHVAPAYKKYIDPYIDELDIIINNNQNFDRGVELIVAYIRERLKAFGI